MLEQELVIKFGADFQKEEIKDNEKLRSILERVSKTKSESVILISGEVEAQYSLKQDFCQGRVWGSLLLERCPVYGGVSVRSESSSARILSPKEIKVDPHQIKPGATSIKIFSEGSKLEVTYSKNSRIYLITKKDD